MGEWFVYDVRFKDESKDLVSAMAEKGVLQRDIGNTGQNNFFKIDFSNLDANEDWSRYTQFNCNHLTVEQKGNALTYSIKWAPDDRFSSCFSKMFPDETVMVSRLYTARGMDSQWYEKNGRVVNKDGVPINSGIGVMNQKLVKECGNGRYKVRFNLGEEGWRTAFFSSSDVWPVTYERALSDFRAEGEERLAGYAVMFVGDNVTLYKDRAQGGGKEEIPVEAFLEKYFAAKNKYADDCRRIVSITGLPENAFTEKHNRNGDTYYLVDIPVTPNIAESGQITIAASDYTVNLVEGSVMLGQKSKVHRAKTMGENGSRIDIEIKNGAIEEAYERATHPERFVRTNATQTEVAVENTQTSQEEPEEEMER